MMRLELVSSGIIDTYDDIGISLNFSIADIEKPDERSASYSKTITLPGTRNNNDLFSHIYEIDSYCNYNPKSKARVILYSNDVFIFEGYLKLNNITVTDEKKEYEVVIFSDTANFFFDISDRLLTDLDFSDLNHTYSRAAIDASWVAPVGVGYVYPEILYKNTPPKNVEDYSPAIYLKEYIDRIFRQAGYTYTSPFFESETFKRLIIPYTAGTPKLLEEDMANRYVRIVKYTSTSYRYDNVYEQIDFDAIGSDVSSQADLTTNFITVQKAGQYKFRLSLNYTSTNLILNSIVVTQKAPYKNHPRGQNIYLVKAGGTDNNGVVMETPVMTLNAGDRLELQVRVDSTSLPGTKVFNLSNVDWIMISANSNIIASAPMVMSNIIPRKIKQKDLFMSVVKLFNLYVDYDKRLPRNIIIEPRGDYYSSGVVTDWNDKIDRSQKIDITPTTDILPKRYKYTYKQDKDYWNNKYQNNYNEVYGTKNYEIDGDLVKGDKSVEVIFSPTPIVVSGYKLLSAIQTADGLPATSEYNIRLLYYNPVYVTSNGVSYFYYAYAGHLDNPYNPYRDFNFGVPQEVYITTNVYTNQNLFNVYYRDSIEEISGNNARIITASVILKESDIATLNFKNIFYFDGHFLRLLSIEDYDPNKISRCKAKFLKIRRKDIDHTSSFTVYTQVNYGGVNNTSTEPVKAGEGKG